jgi:hypothetical protein
MKDRTHALNIVCHQLSILKMFKPPLVNADLEATEGAGDRSIKGLFESIDKEDEKNPPPAGSRLDRFIRRVDDSITWAFFLDTEMLLAFETVNELVDQIMES